MDELLQAIENLKRAYKASGAQGLNIIIDSDYESVEIDGVDQDKRVVTNRQWLESLSDEELAYKLVYGFLRDESYCNEDCYDCKYRDKDCRLEWLRAEHKED